jgi:hypothetical protein
VKKETLPDTAAAAFRLAMLGRAVLGLGPHQEQRPVGTVEAVWLAWGEVLYWTAVSNLDSATRRARADRAWTLLFENSNAAISPLYWLDRRRRIAMLDAGEWFDIVEAWPPEIARLFESVAGNLDELDSAFSFPDHELTHFVIRGLARLPRSRARSLLEPLADRSDVGIAVVEALKELDKHSG